MKTATAMIVMLLAISTAFGQSNSTAGNNEPLSTGDEDTALSPRELEMLRLPVRSSTDLEIPWFNDHINTAAARGEVWTLDAEETALRFIDAPDAPFTNITCTKRPPESPHAATVTVIRGWFADDSLRATWHRIDLERMDFGRWTLTGARRAYLCQRGPQKAYFAADLCP